ncbi:transglycosylase domain-containing protein [Propionimicrobium lymphophilum]|nr:transglycosylase domain-containing protein [Propionimicrobium lymphophilum]
MRSPRPKNRVSILMFVTISVLMGVLVAGITVPVSALGIGLTKTASAALSQVPAELTVPPQRESSRVLLADGSILTDFFEENRQYVPLDQISETMQQAQIAIEDHRFFEHGALDLQSVLRAALGNAAAGGVSGGGSTLTQQYVKLVRQQMCNNEPSCIAEVTAPKFDRKILEMRYAVALEQKLSKKEILERYLNIAYYGDRAYGVQAAAQHYFGVNASELDLAQSALLAGLVQNPSTSDPVNNLDAALARRDAVLNAMVEYQGLPREEADKASETPFDASKVSVKPNGCVGTRYPFICQYAENILTSDQMPGLGSTPKEREDTLRRAGLTIKLNIDPKIQDAAQKAVENVVAPTDDLIAVADTVDPKTGKILAMAQSRPAMGDNKEAGETYWNYSVPMEYGGNDGFMMGSTFKAYAAAAAISSGKYPDTTSYTVRQTQSWNGRSYQDCEGNTRVLNDNPPWVTTNAVAGHTAGTFNMVTGMMWSVNNYFVNLNLDTGPCKTAEMAELSGVELAHPVADENGFGDELKDWGSAPSLVLGAPFVTVLSMASSYGTFGNKGVHCTPIILDSVKTKTGEDIEVPSANCKQTIDPKVASGVNYVLHKTHTSGLSAMSNIPNGIDQASKTGTADDSNGVSAFVGYTPDLSTAVIIAADRESERWRSTPENLRNMRTYHATPLGGPLGYNNDQRIWRALMEPAMEGMPKSKFDPWVPPSDAVPTWNNSTARPAPQPAPKPEPKPEVEEEEYEEEEEE